MPHGENLILVLEDGIPTGAFLKDIAEEVVVFAEPEGGLPPDVARICAAVPEHIRLLSIQTDVFDCFFRFLVPLLDRDAGLSPDAFWGEVAAAIYDYQDAHPELAERFGEYDLFAPTFALSCLNRLQLRNNRQLIDLADPAGALQFAGELDNPLHDHRRPAGATSHQEHAA